MNKVGQAVCFLQIFKGLFTKDEIRGGRKEGRSSGRMEGRKEGRKKVYIIGKEGREGED